MCGFLGWFKAVAQPWSEAGLQLATRSLGSIRHRGPDDGGEASGDGWWMGFRRLSILDLSPGGHQPMSFGKGRHQLTFNGEIYNFRELKASLPPRPFASSGDTEVLGALLESQPLEQVLNKLRGMFAFLWWDAAEQSLVAARDPFGIKPLYYRVGRDGEFWAGSELRALRQLSGAPLQLSKRALAQYFRWGAVQAPDTMVEGIECLPPGHLLRWHKGQVKVERWFTPRWPGQEAWTHGHRAQREEVRKTVLASVEAHLVSDVPVGVFLSGGLDSSLIAACMKHLGQSEVQAFSIGYEEDAGVPDESDTAERTAAHLGCRFVRDRLTADSLEARLDHYFASLDQPTGDALNTYLASQLASQHVKVTLSGLGADEWFAGYNYHRLALLAHKSPLAQSALGRVTGAALRLTEAFLPSQAKGHKAWKALLYAGGGAGGEAAELHARGRTILPPPALARLLGMPLTEAVRCTEDIPLKTGLIADIDQRAPDSWLQQLLMLETETYLPNTLLRDNDCTSMAHGLELRVPLVDREVFALAGRLPPEAKLSMTAGKRVLRDAFRDLLPEWINHDTQKKTFTLPLMKWMRQPKWKARILDTLGSRRALDRGWVNAGQSQRLLDHYFAGNGDTKAGWHLSQPVWMLFVLESWALAQE
ncbi:MAG: hypothetical protein JWO94_1940 [Verrucomicrobiaceae bacterium]|nr:hypothetical protein [Verrucomicrobiaceae bacterium]